MAAAWWGSNSFGGEASGSNKPKGHSITNSMISTRTAHSKSLLTGAAAGNAGMAAAVDTTSWSAGLGYRSQAFVSQ
eukprot:14645426-Alexandrium_andersonii.AAC.1